MHGFIRFLTRIRSGAASLFKFSLNCLSAADKKTLGSILEKRDGPARLLLRLMNVSKPQRKLDKSYRKSGEGSTILKQLCAAAKWQGASDFHTRSGWVRVDTDPRFVAPVRAGSNLSIFTLSLFSVWKLYMFPYLAASSRSAVALIGENGWPLTSNYTNLST